MSQLFGDKEEQPCGSDRETRILSAEPHATYLIANRSYMPAPEVM